MESRRRILVVDDEPTIRELIADALSEFGYEVEVAANGVAALEITHRWAPDAIVLDLMMPQLSGLEFITLLRRDPDFESVPVLLVTATYGAEETAERICATAVLSKPFELDRLVQLVGDMFTLEPSSWSAPAAAPR